MLSDAFQRFVARLRGVVQSQTRVRRARRRTQPNLQVTERLENRALLTAVVPFAQPAVVATAPAAPGWSLAADVDGDGDQDAIVASAASNSLVWLPNDGAGQFGTAVTISSSGKPNVIDVGDLDGDGDLDVLAFRTDPAEIVWFANDGAGNFGSALAVGASAGSARGQLADVNDDGHLDVVLNANGAGTVSYYPNNGSGNFGSAIQIASGLPFAFHLGFADLDGDGDTDMAAPSTVDNAAFWFANDGAGNFGAAQAVSTSTSAAFDAFPADFNGDGTIDIGVAYYYQNRVVYYPNDGTGNFGAGVNVVTGVSGAFGVQLTDFDGDGHQDALVTGVGTGEMVWAAGDGAGNFGSQAVAMSLPAVFVSSATAADLDGDGDTDILANGSGAAVYFGENRLGESATAVVPPAAGSYLTNQQIDVGVYFGYPVTVSGTPSIAMTVGGQTVQAHYVAGSGTNQLTFRYVVAAGVTDADGVVLGNQIALNGGTITGPDFAPVLNLSVPAADLSGVTVNGTAPLVTNVTRTDANPTAERFVRFAVTFDRPVNGVNAADFTVTADGVTGAAVTEVVGAGTTYVVTVSTGTGSGTIRLDVKSGASVANAAGTPLAAGFTGGQVYSLQRQAERIIDDYYTVGHGDLGANYVDGKWQFEVTVDGQGTFAPDEIVIVAGPSALTPVPAGPEWSFIGAASGESVYRLPSTPSVDLPFLGLGAEHTERGTFASYFESDPRVAGTSPWIKFTLVGVDAPAGGQFSMYTSTDTGPKVWMSTADGVNSADAFWAREGSHDHFNTTFTEPGHYELSFVASGYLDANGNGTYDPGIDPYNESGIVTFYFDVDPAGGPTPYTIPADPLTPPVPVPFARPVPVSTADSVNSAATADLDGDGDQDVLTAAGGDGQVLFTENLGRGAFAAPVIIAAGLPDASAVAAADLDGDGDLDVLAVNTGGTAVWVENLGGGTFASQRQITDQLDGSYWIAAGDLDGDGDLDVVGAAPNSNTVAWFANRLNEAGNDFGPLRVITTEAPFVVNLEVVDLDSDGKLDVAYMEVVDPTLAWSRNLGDGTFGPRQVIAAVPGGYWMATGDLDGDGDVDALAAANDTAEVLWYANDGTGQFGPAQVAAADVPRVSTVSVADVNGDGRADVLAVGLNGLVTWSENLGGGTFRTRQVIANRPGTVPVGVTAADLDGDGDHDVLVSEYRGDRVNWYENHSGERVNELTPPAASTYLIGQVLEFSWFVGSNVTVGTDGGVPSLPLTIGSNQRQATFVAQPDPSTLVFRYTVQAGDVDADGIAVGPAVALNGGTIRDVYGADAPLDLPAADTRAVRVDGDGPVVVGVTRAGANPTAAGTVTYTVTFSEPVIGVDAADFAVTASGVTGATVAEVSGTGATWTVTVATGTGTGTVRLDVRADASVTDLTGSKLGGGFVSGQVYTLNRVAVPRTISEYVTDEHLDLTPNYLDGAWELGWHVDGESGPVEYASDGVLVVAGAEARRDRPAGTPFDFLGVAAGAPVWVLPQNQQVGVPYPGIGAEDTAATTFAKYLETDPRLGTEAAWIRVGLVAVRGPAGGHFSLYQSTDTGPKVWMASADGITVQDAAWVVPGGHTHYNWAFTQPGNYQIDVVASGYLDANGNGAYDPGLDPYTESGVTTYYFQVNEADGPTPVTLPADVPPPPPTLVPFGRPQVVGSVLAGVAEQVAVDLDNDGDLDLAVAAYDANKVVWFENLGGMFGPARVLSDDATEPWFITAGDFDGDGKTDVAAGLYSESLIWFRNLGGGAFAPAQTVDTGFTPRLASGDLNGDGRADLVTYAPLDGGTAIYFYPGTATGPGSKQLVLGGLNGVNGLLASDVDGDGDADILFGEGTASGVKGLGWVLSNGDGTFGPKQSVAGGFRTNLSRVQQGDLSGDGRLDVLSMEIGTGNVAWYENLGGGNFGPRQLVPVSVTGVYTLAVADFNGDGFGDIAAANYSTESEMVWVANDGAGGFGSQLVVSTAGGQVVTLAAGDFDADGDSDLTAASPSLGQVSYFENRLGEFATEVVAPAARTYLIGQTLDVIVHFGYPVAVTGSPSVALAVGGRTVQATYLSGTGMPDLLFRYLVTADDIDADGIELAAPTVVLNGGTITDPLGNPAPLSLPGADLSGVRVNGSAPIVTNVIRLDSAATNAGTVRFRVTFSELVTGVDVTDFGTAADGVAGAAVTAVSGSGAEYTVTIDTGTGSGTLGLTVRGGASITDAAGYALAEGFSGGEVYTLLRRPARTIDEFYETGHGDIGIGYADSLWDLHVHSDVLGEEFAPDELVIYGGPEGLRATPTGPEWAFLGAGEQSYYFPQNGSIAGVPDLGISAEEIAPGTFASYQTNDPRASGTLPWLKLQMVGFRGPSEGNFSVYKSDDDGPTVYFATSDGIDAGDVLYVPQVSHSHYNFAFSAAGNYEIDVVASGYLDSNGNGTYDEGIDSYTESGVTTFYFGIDLPGGQPATYTIAADAIPPEIIVSPGPTTLTEGRTVIVDPEITLQDQDGDDFTNGKVQVSIIAGAQPDDRLKLVDNGRGADRLRVTRSGNVKLGRRVIGTVTSSGGSSLEITFASGTTKSQVQRVLRNVGLQVKRRQAGIRNVQFVVFDSTGNSSAPLTKDVEIA